MTKKKNIIGDFDTAAENAQPTQSPELEEDVAAPSAQPIYFERVMWKGVKEVFKCEACGTCRDDEDSMIEHVLTHILLAEQEKLLDQLIKEKNKWQHLQ